MGQTSGASSLRRAWNCGSPARLGERTSSPSAKARSLTGEATKDRPRPDGASGRVTTATTSCDELDNASRLGTAASGVPAKTSRTRSATRSESCVRAGLDDGRLLAGPLGVADRLHGQLAVCLVHAVDEQDAVEVVRLVLDAASQQLCSLTHDRLAMLVETLGHQAKRPGGVKEDAGEGQTALLALLHLRGEVEAGIDQMNKLVIDVIGEDPQSTPDLRGRQAGARRVHHGVGQVLDQLAQFLVKVDNLDGGSTQHGVTEDPNVHDRHERGSLPSSALSEISLCVRQRQATQQQIVAKVAGVGEQDGVQAGLAGSLDVCL